MRRHAYILAADPTYLAASVRAYYPVVDRIVVSYDRGHRSWAGQHLPGEEAIAQVKAVDVDGKCVLAPGDYSDPDGPVLDVETHQRQTALDQASEGADWVLTLDTDEVIRRLDPFLGALGRAEDAGADALHYPARWLYNRVGEDLFLETSTRWGRTVTHYPGPLAVRAGTRLDHCRQTLAPHYRVDIRPWNADPYHPRGTLVHEVVHPRDAVMHFSWVRDDAAMRAKFAWSGHADQYAEPTVYRHWVWRTQHPRLAAAASVLRRHDRDRYRVLHLPGAPEARV
ncbi:hypothetical protein [Cellulosimicrobium cellulans]|uniref:hypothetical protein n=1 Tax=Cellulosimicrobium cellulans TaxID=1710 RepID=UPI0016529B8B|nr:hypothetical protein [Cellulosimicrobium cellulans]